MILKIFKKISDFLQTWVGLDSLLLAKMLCILAAIVHTIEIIVFSRAGMPPIVNIANSVIPTMFIIYMIPRINSLRQKYKENPNYDTTQLVRMLAAPRFIFFIFALFGIRAIYLSVQAIPEIKDLKLYYETVYKIVMSTHTINTVIVLYFCCCSPKNLNNPSWLRKFLRKIKIVNT